MNYGSLNNAPSIIKGRRKMKSMITANALFLMSGLVMAAGCYNEGDSIVLKGTASIQPLELANGKTNTVWVLTPTSPICVTELASDSGKPKQANVSRLQIIGTPPPANILIELSGTLSTGNFTQYYAEPTAIKVTSGRRIAAEQVSTDNQDSYKAGRLNEQASRKNEVSDKANPSNYVERFFVLLLLAYFLPTILAVTLKRKNAAAIFAANLFVGWTFFGWVIALVWALKVD